MALPQHDQLHALTALNGALARSARADVGKPWRIQGLQGGGRAYFLWRTLTAAPRPTLIVCPTSKEAETLVEDLRSFFEENDSASLLHRRIHYFPAWDVAPFEDLSPTPDIAAARVEGLYHLQQTQNPIVVTTAEALLQRVPPQSQFAAHVQYLVITDEVDLGSLAKRLDDWGYRRVGLVEDRGDFSIRGGILDVFPPGQPNPLRIELDGDLIEKIHEFDPVTQRSGAELQEFLILPVREFDASGRRDRATIDAIEDRALELEVGREERNQLLDDLETGLLFPGIEFLLPYFYPALDTLAAYLPANTVIWLDGAGDVDAALEATAKNIECHVAERHAGHRFLAPPEKLYLSPTDWRHAFAPFPSVELEPLQLLAADNDDHHLHVSSFLTRDLKISRTPGKREVSFGPVAERVNQWAHQMQRVLVVVSTAAQIQRVTRLFANHDVHAEVGTSIVEALGADAGRLRIVQGHLSDGFRIPDERLVIVTEADIFGEARQRRRARPVEVTQLLKNLSEIKPNDYVVHIDHGVGRYCGLKHLKVADTEGDYLHLEYQGGDKLYLPVDRINLVQKYTGSDAAAPPLDKLGGTSWERIKKKTKESILAMAKELLEVYATREVVARKTFTTPDTYFREFEAAFPFEETEGQQRAIDEVLGDMVKAKPMDRLICGDVGFGKTEVALRAAFLAVIDGRQVAVLVPTTVLAQQHYNTFKQRMQNYPVRVEMVSRFRSTAENKATVKGLGDGTVDIVIGTHRLLQKDVAFKNLGLLVIDEEHRFGVKHKEQIKQIRKLIDCLTLTATPIPRTLQMSLLGIRDLSVIETPPIDRLAIRTYVTRFDEGVIREAIVREKARSGQVFFVHNRVETIEARARQLRALVPECTFTVGHGQMDENDLEGVMSDFMNKRFDVLVCSAIIESGLDIPNANTILIDRADHFGLAQLYQLRGRVGRSHERAYAYLMIPGEQIITRDAQLRLKALQELDDLGGGFRLAAHDLEIRGAGNLLGKQQSGQITAVGFELYQQMMEEAVRELQGQQVTHDIEPEIQLGVPAYLPEAYIPDEDQRLVFYRRLASVRGQLDLDAISEELRERYGPIPPLVDNFMRVMDLRRSLKDRMVVRAALRQGLVTLQFHPEAPVDVDTLVGLVKKGKGRFKLSQDFQLSFRPESTDWDGLVAETKSVLQAVGSAC